MNFWTHRSAHNTLEKVQVIRSLLYIITLLMTGDFELWSTASLSCIISLTTTSESPSSNGRSSVYDIHMVNLSYVSQVTVTREAAGSPLPSLPSLNLSKVSPRDFSIPWHSLFTQVEWNIFFIIPRTRVEVTCKHTAHVHTAYEVIHVQNLDFGHSYINLLFVHVFLYFLKYTNL